MSNDYMAMAGKAAEESRNQTGGNMRSYALVVDAYDVPNNTIIGRELKTNEARKVTLSEATPQNAERPTVADFAKDPAKTKKIATAIGGVVIVKNAFPRGDTDVAFWVETGKKSSRPEHGEVIQGMAKVGDSFSYVTGDGVRGSSRHIQMIDNSKVVNVTDADTLANTIGRAMNANTLVTATSTLALVQLSNGIEGQNTPGVVVTRRKDETAEEAVDRAMQNDPVLKLVQQALSDPDATGLYARVMPGQMFFIGKMLQKSLNESAMDVTVPDKDGKPGWSETILTVLPYDPTQPSSGYFVGGISTTVPRKNLVGMTPDQITPASTTLSLSQEASNSNATTPSATATAERPTGTLGDLVSQGGGNEARNNAMASIRQNAAAKPNTETKQETAQPAPGPALV